MKVVDNNELFRVVSIKQDHTTNQTITIEMKSAQGKNYRQWASILSKNGKKYGLSYDMQKGLADSPVFNIHHWSGSKTKVRTLVQGTVHNDRLYLIAHWQDKVGLRRYVGKENIRPLASSWRWLKQKPKPNEKVTP